MLHSGKYVEKDQKTSNLFIKACEMDFTDVCHNLWVIYFKAKGVKSDKNLAKNNLASPAS